MWKYLWIAILFLVVSCDHSGTDKPSSWVNEYTKEKAASFSNFTLSHTPGFYKNPFSLKVESGHEVYYTYNGRSPHPDSSYTQLCDSPIAIVARNEELNQHSSIPTTPIPFPSYYQWKEPQGNVRKCTSIIFQCYDGDTAIGSPEVCSYFIIPEQNRTYSVPVVSLNTNAALLFDKQSGLMVPGKAFDENNPNWSGNYFQNVSIEAYLEYFDRGSRVFEQKVRFKIHGSRTTAAPQKSLRIYTDLKGTESLPLEYSFFTDSTISLKRFVLRTPFTTWHDRFFANHIVSGISKKLNVLSTQGSPVILYLNGEYWGLYTLRERIDEYFVKSREDCEVMDIRLLDGNEFGSDESSEMYAINQLLKAKTPPSKQMWEQINSTIDLESLIDYYILNIHFSNTDWPLNNYEIYSCDSSWKFVTTDCDAGFRDEAYNYFDKYVYLDPDTIDRSEILLFHHLLQHPNFKQDFIDRYTTLLNGPLHSDSIMEVIDNTEKLYQLEMKEQIHRWNFPSSYGRWETTTDYMRYFARERPKYIQEQLRILSQYEYISKSE